MLLDSTFGQENFRSKITWNTGDNISGFKSQAMDWIRQADFIQYYSATSSPFFVKAFTPLDKNTLHIGWLDIIGKDKDNLYIETWEDGQLIQKKVNHRVKALGTIWNDIYSFQYSEPRITESLSFASNQKPENLLRRIIQTSSEIDKIVLDCYAGSGTTCAVAHKLSRKWIGIEMGEFFNEFYFDEVKIKKNSPETSEEEELFQTNPSIVKITSQTGSTITAIVRKIGTLGRMKIVLNGDQEFKAIHSPVKRRPHLSKDINWKGGGFFKYYELEQYEGVLQKAHYEDSTLFNDPHQDPYSSYVFLRDLKMLESLEVDLANNRVRFYPERLYPDIDLAETLSHLTGKWIKRITKEFVEFQDGTQMSLVDPDWQTLKPMIWWQ